MSRRKKYKVGDRIFFEYYDGTVGTATVLEIIPDTYTDENNKLIHYDKLVTYKGEHFKEQIEDYETLPLSDPRVKELQKQLAKQDSLAQDIRDWIVNKCETYPDYYDNEIIAAALGQVAKEYGYEED